MNRRKEEEGREEAPLPSIEEAGKLLYSLFEYRLDRPSSPATQELLGRKNLFLIPGSYLDGWSTKLNSFDSPKISRENVDGAEKIITVTMEHHVAFLDSEEEDLVFAFYPDESIRAFRYPKGDCEGAKGLFQEVESLEEVGRFIRTRYEHPQREGARMSLWWEQAQEEYYSYVSGFGSRMATVLGILEFIKEFPVKDFVRTYGKERTFGSGVPKEAWSLEDQERMAKGERPTGYPEHPNV